MKKMIFTGVLAFICMFMASTVYAKTAVWIENNPEVSVYDDVQGDGFNSVDYYEKQYFVKHKVGEIIPLLMVDGGFVANHDIIFRGGRALVPAEILAEVLSVQMEFSVDSSSMLIEGYGNEMKMSFGESEAFVNGLSVVVDVSPEMAENVAYVPLRFIAENIGAQVSYIPQLNYGYEFDVATEGTRMLARNMVCVIVVETNRPHEKVYTVEEGLKTVQEASAIMYKQVADYLTETDREFSSIDKDYDPAAIHYTGMDIGRYYLYVLKGFEKMPIYFNKYTGEIFAEHAGLPFINVDRGFINISWLYQ